MVIQPKGHPIIESREKAMDLETRVSLLAVMKPRLPNYIVTAVQPLPVVPVVFGGQININILSEHYLFRLRTMWIQLVSAKKKFYMQVLHSEINHGFFKRNLLYVNQTEYNILHLAIKKIDSIGLQSDDIIIPV